MIVVDTNIIVYFHVSSTETVKTNQAFLQDSDWVVPSLWRNEFRHALAQYVKHKVISLNEAVQLAMTAEQLLNGKEYEVGADKVLALALRSGCSAYDCEFVVLAQDLGVPLLTADQKLLRAFPHTAVSLEQFLT